jgi:FkbM family methyltransferase
MSYLLHTQIGVFRTDVPMNYGPFDRKDGYDWIDFELTQKGVFSPIHTWIMENFVTEDSIVVDVGAHIGVFAIPASMKAKKVHAFEPVIESFQRLTDHIVLNQADNIVPYNFALGEDHSLAELEYCPKFNTGGATLNISRGSLQIPDLGDEHAPPTYPILVKTLDSLELEACDFIKCDTEGCELLVVRGGLETIKKFRPVMVMEHNNEEWNEEVLKLLESAGVPYTSTKIHDPTMTNEDGDNDYLYEPMKY